MKFEFKRNLKLQSQLFRILKIYQIRISIYKGLEKIGLLKLTNITWYVMPNYMFMANAQNLVSGISASLFSSSFFCLAFI